jgi:hypothetical protein
MNLHPTKKESKQSEGSFFKKDSDQFSAVQRTEDVIMARKNVADLLVDVLAETGVPRIYGVSGDSLNGITDSIRTSKRIQLSASC